MRFDPAQIHYAGQSLGGIIGATFVPLDPEIARGLSALDDGRIARVLAPFNVSPVCQGDPRGACVKLRVPSGRTDDWGQTGVCVPTPNY